MIKSSQHPVVRCPRQFMLFRALLNVAQDDVIVPELHLESPLQSSPDKFSQTNAIRVLTRIC